MTPAMENNRPHWEIEDTNPELIDKLKAALSEVTDPEIGFNVIQLGLIRNITLKDNKVSINMILTTPFCPYGPAMLEMTRKKAEEALGMETEIDFGAEIWDFSMMEEGLGADWGLF